MEGGGVTHAAVGGGVRNRVRRLITTDMRTTQGQDAFGHNVQTIITYLNMVHVF
jgi:hypothetical protein